MWKHWEVTSRVLAWGFSHIHRLSDVHSPLLFPPLPNITCTFPLKHHNPLPLNPFSIIQMIQWSPFLECQEPICNSCHLVQECTLKLFRTVLPPDIGLTLFSINLATHTFFHLLNALWLACPILFANRCKGNSVCFRQIGSLTSVPPKTDISLLSISASHSW